MRRVVQWTAIFGLSSCRAAPQPPPPSEPPVLAAAVDESRGDAPPNDAIVSWSSLKSEVESVMCVKTLDVPDRGSFDVPTYGDRDACGLEPPTTAVQRAVDAAFEEAKGVLISLRAERDAAHAAAHGDDPDERIEAVRRAYMTEEFLGVLLPRLDAALEAEGLRCDGCPTPVHPPRREVTWAVFEPYLLAHVWPDPVVTPRDAKGRASGKPKLSVHICGGINGVSELGEADPVLVRAGYLAAFHTEAIHERGLAFLGAMKSDRAFQNKRTDAARTAYLREAIGPWLLGDPKVRPGVCETLERFEMDTGVVVTDCREASVDETP